MTFLPIVTRELRVAARRRGTYWIRTGAGVLVIAAGTWVFAVTQGEPPRTIALSLFYTLSGSAVLYSLLSGLRTTADCLSEEKREGTLGLLFLTDLKGYDVVLGKLAASSLNAFYSVVAILPMLAIPLLLGGMTPAEFWRMALVTLNALFFSLAAGMCVSSASRVAQRAVTFTAGSILFFTALLPACGTLLALAGKTRAVASFFLFPSIGFSYYSALDSVYRAGHGPFWYSMGLIHGLSWLGLALASVIAPRSWQDKSPGTRQLRWRERFRLWSYGSPVERLEFRRRLLEKNPFFWLASRVRVKPAAVWAFLGVLACGWVWGLAKYRRDWLNEAIYVSTGLFLNFVLRWWFGAEATRQIAEDRKAGTLELLLSTPLSVEEILRGQMLALGRQFLGPVLAVLMVECLFMMATISGDFSGTNHAFWYSLYGTGMVMLVADLGALYWVGMWQGLTARSQARALNASLLRILVCPWIGMAVVMLVMAVAAMGGMNPPEPTWQLLLGAWFMLGLATDAAFAAMAYSKLRLEFRLAAQQTYARPAGFWLRLLGKAPPSSQEMAPRMAAGK